MLDIAVVVPTYNERANVVELISRLDRALTGLVWEVIFVDDDSPDRTGEFLRSLSMHDPRIRVVHRIGRRGLSSACIEGILATSADSIAVMDGDMQHDESVLREMLAKLHSEKLDVVIGTRHAYGGSTGDFSKGRVRISYFGRFIADSICRCNVSDPMSGFFVIDRSFFNEVVRSLYGGGFKILFDLLATSARPVHFAEVGYVFRSRKRGESKLGIDSIAEYGSLVFDKLTNSIVPVRFIPFSLVGSIGVTTHVFLMWVLLQQFHWEFLMAQVVVTYVAMTENFFLNNFITWRDRSFHGFRLWLGLFSFWLVCSFGAVANLVLAQWLLSKGVLWFFASTGGVALSSVWNYSMSNLFIWQTPRRVASSTYPIHVGTHKS